QRAAGSLDAFAREMQHEAALLRLVDSPQLDDPTGLDHTYDHGGGDWISAWDLALVARQAMSIPSIAAAARVPRTSFVDNAGRSHRLVNRNLLIGRYLGAT